MYIFEQDEFSTLFFVRLMVSGMIKTIFNKQKLMSRTMKATTSINTHALRKTGNLLALAGILACSTCLTAWAEDTTSLTTASYTATAPADAAPPPAQSVDQQQDILNGQSIDATPTASVNRHEDTSTSVIFPESNLPPLVAHESEPGPKTVLSLQHPVSRPYVPENILTQQPAKEEPVAAAVTAGPSEAEQLKAALAQWQAGPAARAIDQKRREAIVSFYTARNFEPLWRKDGKWTSEAHEALTRTEKANEDGLDLVGMHLPILGQDNLAADDIALSDLVTAYAAQAAGGRIDPSEISKLITAKPTPPDFASVLAQVSGAANLSPWSRSRFRLAPCLKWA